MGRLVCGGLPGAVVDDSRQRCGASVQKVSSNGAAGCSRRVGVLDAVGRGLAHRQHDVVLGIPGKHQRRQPATNVGPYRRQLAGIRGRAATRCGLEGGPASEDLTQRPSATTGVWGKPLFRRLILPPAAIHDPQHCWIDVTRGREVSFCFPGARMSSASAIWTSIRRVVSGGPVCGVGWAGHRRSIWSLSRSAPSRVCGSAGPVRTGWVWTAQRSPC